MNVVQVSQGSRLLWVFPHLGSTTATSAGSSISITPNPPYHTSPSVQRAKHWRDETKVSGLGCVRACACVCVSDNDHHIILLISATHWGSSSLTGWQIALFWIKHQCRDSCTTHNYTTCVAAVRRKAICKVSSRLYLGYQIIRKERRDGAGVFRCVWSGCEAVGSDRCVICYMRHWNAALLSWNLHKTNVQRWITLSAKCSPSSFCFGPCRQQFHSHMSQRSTSLLRRQ